MYIELICVCEEVSRGYRHHVKFTNIICLFDFFQMQNAYISLYRCIYLISTAIILQKLSFNSVNVLFL